MNWINSKNGLPEAGRLVLGFVASENKVITIHVDRDSGRWLDQDMRSYLFNDVTHWTDDFELPVQILDIIGIGHKDLSV